MAINHGFHTTMTAHPGTADELPAAHPARTQNAEQAAGR